MSAPPAATHRYLLALGSNQRHHRHGAPPAILRAACRALVAQGVIIDAVSPTLTTPPIGPSARRYANACAVISTALTPPALLHLCQTIEAQFGRRRRGQRWRARPLDLDLVLWSGGCWRTRRPALTVPHPLCTHRTFVLTPARSVAPTWRIAPGALTIRHHHARLTKPRPTRPAPTPP